jgi:hypothetical protein
MSTEAKQTPEEVMIEIEELENKTAPSSAMEALDLP